MPDLHDLLSAEADPLRPERAPSYDAVIAGRNRHRRRVIAVGSAAAVAAVAAVVLVPTVTRSHHQDTLLPAQQPARAPDVLTIECTSTGATLPDGNRVSAQRDGVHYLFRNQTDGPVNVSYELAGDVVAARATKAVVTSRLAPGAATAVACGDSGESRRSHAMPVTVEDPDGVYVPVPACEGQSVIQDFVSPMQGDPVSLTRRDHAQADPVGYPEGSPRLVFTGDTLIAWEGGGNAWVPSTTTRCESGARHSVAAGISAPPPTRLNHTDEFGLITGLGDTTVTVDRVDMLGGAEAEAAAGGPVANDYFLRNDSPRTRSYRVSPDVRVWAGIRFGIAPPSQVLVGLDRLRSFVTTPDVKDTLFHFEVSDGLVVGIEEQYRP